MKSTLRSQKLPSQLPETGLDLGSVGPLGSKCGASPPRKRNKDLYNKFFFVKTTITSYLKIVQLHTVIQADWHSNTVKIF